MNYRKAQIGLRELLTTLIVAGILAIVGVMIFSKVSSTTENIFDRNSFTVVNESIAMVSQSGATTYGPAATEDVTAVTFFGNVSKSTYESGISINTQVNWSANGSIIVSGVNFSSDDTYNISYAYDRDSDAMLSKDTIEDTVLDAFELGVIALIVLAAVVILGTLFMLGGQ